VQIPCRGYAVFPVPGGHDVYIDTNGDGVPDSKWELRDLNNDGDFGDPGEVTTSPVSAP